MSHSTQTERHSLETVGEFEAISGGALHATREEPRPAGPTVYLDDDGTMYHDGEALPGNHPDPSSTTTTDQPQAGGRSVRLLSHEDLGAMSRPGWLIKGWLPDHGVTELYGAPKSFKSFLALDWSLSVVSGEPWNGHNVKRGGVIYLSLEGGNGMRDRWDAWSMNHSDPETSSFKVVVDPMNLRDGTDVGALMDAAREQMGDDTKLIVVDTLSRAMAGGDENSPVDMPQFVAGCTRMANTLGVAVLTLHHSGHEASRRSRGHSSWRGALDVSVGVVRSGKDVVKIRQDYVRFADERAPVKMTRRIVDLGVVDEDGDPVTSMVLDYKGGASGRDDDQDSSDEVRDDRVRGLILSYLAEHGPASDNQVKTDVGQLFRKSKGQIGSDDLKALLDGLVDDGKVSRHKQGRSNMNALPGEGSP